MPTVALLTLIEQTLEFTYYQGAITPLSLPHTTGWRTLPYLVTAHVDGAGILDVAGRRALRSRTGHAMCIPAGILHRGTMTSLTGVSRWSHVSFLIRGGIDVLSLLDCPPLFYGKPARRLGEINVELAALQKSTTPTLEDIARKRSLGFALLEVIARVSSWRSGTDRLVLDSQRLAPVFAAIQQKLSGRIRIEELAALAFLSVPRFHVVFRQATAMTPYVFVQKQRLKRAQDLLLSTDLSISEVAAQVGQHDPFFFSRTFKQQCQMTPTDYRRNLKDNQTP